MRTTAEKIGRCCASCAHYRAYNGLCSRDWIKVPPNRRECPAWRAG